MERPVYYIKGIVKAREEVPGDFTGPLDLILHLLRRNRLEIRDIPLSDILDQYLAWVAARRTLDLTVAGEFITMASHLMLLKTRMLLSEKDPEAKTEMEELMASLEQQQYREACLRVQSVLPALQDGYLSGRERFPKKPEARYARRVYHYSYTPGDLQQTMESWHRRRENAAPPDKTWVPPGIPKKPYEVERKTEQLLGQLEERGVLSLDALLSRSRSLSEATAVFLAVLELCRRGKIQLSGPEETVVLSLSPEGTWQEDAYGTTRD